MLSFLYFVALAFTVGTITLVPIVTGSGGCSAYCLTVISQCLLYQRWNVIHIQESSLVNVRARDARKERVFFLIQKLY